MRFVRHHHFEGLNYGGSTRLSSCLQRQRHAGRGVNCTHEPNALGFVCCGFFQGGLKFCGKTQPDPGFLHQGDAIDIPVIELYPFTGANDIVRIHFRLENCVGVRLAFVSGESVERSQLLDHVFEALTLNKDQFGLVFSSCLVGFVDTGVCNFPHLRHRPLAF
ncbi:hypothetical protein D3C80_838620 [compost metagenome]